MVTYLCITNILIHTIQKLRKLSVNDYVIYIFFKNIKI